MDIDLVGYVRRELLALPRSEWRLIAETAGVGESTIEKYAYGVTDNPSAIRIQTIAKILMNRNGAIESAR